MPEDRTLDPAGEEPTSQAALLEPGVEREVALLLAADLAAAAASVEPDEGAWRAITAQLPRRRSKLATAARWASVAAVAAVAAVAVAPDVLAPLVNGAWNDTQGAFNSNTSGADAQSFGSSQESAVADRDASFPNPLSGLGELFSGDDDPDAGAADSAPAEESRDDVAPATAADPADVPFGEVLELGDGLDLPADLGPGGTRRWSVAVPAGELVVERVFLGESVPRALPRVEVRADTGLLLGDSSLVAVDRAQVVIVEVINSSERAVELVVRLSR